MRTHLTLLFLLCQILGLCQSDWIFPYEKNGLYGYTNSFGDTISAAVFQEAWETYGRLARIKIRGKYGFVDNSGKIVIKPKYLQAEDFYAGAATVFTKRGKLIAIKPDGSRYKLMREIHGAHRSCLHPFLNERYIIRENGKYGFVKNKHGRLNNGSVFYYPDTLQPKFDTVVPITNQLMYVAVDGRIAFVFDGSFAGGAEYIDNALRFEYDEVVTYPCPFVPDMRYEILAVRKGNLWGFALIHNMPKITCPARYLSIRSFNPYGMPLVEYEPGRFGYVNPRTGEEFFCK